MNSSFVAQCLLLLSLLMIGCDSAPSGASQPSGNKLSGNRFGDIPVDNKDPFNQSSEGTKPWERNWGPDVSALKERAEKGDAEAQFDLGEAYRTGNGVAKDVTEAVAWYEKTANTKRANRFDKYANQQQINEWPQTKAQFRLGMMYSDGEGVSKDIQKSVLWYEMAAAMGMAEAQHNLAVIYHNGNGIAKDESKAFEWFQKAATQGLAEAQFALGEMYRKGHGTARDIVRSVEWYQSAAAQGLASAQTRLGLMYSDGIGVPKDAAKAVEWYQKAATQGQTGAQINLGRSYAVGEGVPKDQVLAYAWFNLAASQAGNDVSDMASKNRVLSERTMSAKEIAEAQRLSSSWQPGHLLRREAEGGNISTLPGESSQGGALKMTGTGTLFVVSVQGKAITNAHVVKDCTELHIESRDGLATITTMDAVNDLALIQIPGTAPATAPIAKEPGKLRQGEDIVVFGFPLNTVLSSGGNLTPGVVSAMTGLGNNSNQIQITAPIQPGSSGSPVLNKKGEVVGVVSMKLSDTKMAAATGSVGQNVNFAVSGQTLKAFLDAHEVRYKAGAGFFQREMSPVGLADEARKWTLVVECWK